MRIVRTVLAFVAVALLGAVIGVVGTFQHPAYWTVGDTRLGTGVIAGVAALVLAQFVARDALPLGLGPAVVLIAWTAVVVVLGSTTTAGDIAVPAGLSGEGFLYGGFLAGLIAAGVFAFRTSGRRPAGR